MSEHAPPRSPHWFGMLCDQTRDEIASRMRAVLADNYFTMVICNSYSEDSERFTGIEVYPSQWLTRPVEAYQDSAVPGISWATPRLVFGVHNKAATQSEARDGGPHNYVHFTFERDQIAIDHYAPAGFRLRWIFAVERHERED